MDKKHSFNSLIDDGVIKRGKDGMNVDHSKLVRVWNARDHDERWEESIEALVEYLGSGGQVPALEVRVNESNGDIEIVEGYRREEAYGRLIARGHPVGRINIVPFRGNDADRIARIATSNNQLPLTALETAQVYKRLGALNLGAAEIATLVHKSRPHVDNYLVLAYANTDVQTLVRSGHVSADTAIKFVRTYGEDAGRQLEFELQRARGQGKARVTNGTVKGKGLPAKVREVVIDSVDQFASSIDTRTRTRLYEIEKSGKVETATIEVPARMVAMLLEVHGEAEAVRAKREAKQREREQRVAQQSLGASHA